ncbi:hypothetical protein D3C78_1971600 [compost metagenome]
MLVAKLLEQFQATAIRQHHVEHDRRRRVLGQGAPGTLAIMAGAHLKAFLAQPTGQELTQLLVIIY